MPRQLVLITVTVMLLSRFATGAEQPRALQYFAHPATVDRYGVIAPWYQALNGQCDLRVRIAAETLKRYPWADNRWPQAHAHFVSTGIGRSARWDHPPPLH
jgi:hypothetical protein